MLSLVQRVDVLHAQFNSQTGTVLNMVAATGDSRVNNQGPEGGATYQYCTEIQNLQLALFRREHFIPAVR